MDRTRAKLLKNKTKQHNKNRRVALSFGVAISKIPYDLDLANNKKKKKQLKYFIANK